MPLLTRPYGFTLLLLAVLLHTATSISAQDNTLPIRRSIEMPLLTVLGNKQVYIEDNPAVALIEFMGNAERLRRDTTTINFSYAVQDRTLIALSNTDKWQWLLTKVLPYADHYFTTSSLDGTPLLPLSVRNKATLMGYNAREHRTNEKVIHQEVVGIDRDLSDGIVTIQLEHLLPKIDLYEATIRMLDTDIPSPIGTNARRFYKFYLTDTIISQGRIAQVVSFLPRHPNAPSFNGQLVISVEETPHLLQALLLFPKFTNVNYVKELKVQQWFDADEYLGWHLREEALQARFKLFLESLSFGVEHDRYYSNFDFSTPDSTLIYTKQQYQDVSKNPSSRVLLKELQNNQIIASEEGLKHFMDEVRGNSWQRFILETVDMISLNYLRTHWDYSKVYGGSKFDIGPIDQILGTNAEERLRIRVGGRTTGYFSRRNFLEGYLAYGTGDGKWKYGVTFAHSFKPKRYFREEYPRHELSATFRHDLHTPGQLIENHDRTNILYDVGVPYLTSRSMRNSFRVEYLNELTPNISFRVYGNYYRDIPVGSLSYVRVNGDGSVEKIPQLVDVSLGAEVRWSPGERIFEGSMQRHHFYAIPQREVPIFRLRHEWADNAFGGDFVRHRTEVSVEQRVWMGAYGRFDYLFTVGKLWNAVPYPLLYTPPANGSIWYYRHSFQLLKPLEFVADNWATAHLEYHARGALFDRIPGVKWLRLRGVLTCNMLYGNLSAKNKSTTGDELFLLPTNATEMQNDVYAEVGFGLENILEVLRVDVYRRLTPRTKYSNGPWGVKLLVSLTF